ncbi:dihydroxyacetone kinase transcriptional activator DhaS [Agrilactobacillus yilanensis]|uniref:Dihydroxyacetone kinase transcriptional activator DhaS n=1 Tax=Agrilactobacillus yilanensis TaxID=2485997 RepID=A0ABW4J4E2_9LACO|nr:dihydroxyacetone kinase transcriptional activator DhaS [Agrilactobacillus yilanensis]
MSYIVKKKIAVAAKALISQKGLEKVSVTNIMATAQLRRQTFYDYFQDKYDLLVWLYEDEVSQVVDDNLNYEHWSKVLYHLCGYFADNRAFYCQVFENHAQNAPGLAIEAHTHHLVDLIVTDMVQTRKIDIKTAYRHFLVNFLTNGLVSEIKWWLANEVEIDAKVEFKAVQQIIEDTFNGLLLRTAPITRYEHQEISI